MLKFKIYLPGYEGLFSRQVLPLIFLKFLICAIIEKDENALLKSQNPLPCQTAKNKTLYLKQNENLEERNFS